VERSTPINATCLLRKHTTDKRPIPFDGSDFGLFNYRYRPSSIMSVFQAVVYSIFFLFYFLSQAYSESYEKQLIVKDADRPGVVKFHKTYYMVESDSKIFSSKDLKNWARENDLLFYNNGPPMWIESRNIYSPEIQFINEKYNLYYNIKDDIGVAAAGSPVGPFKDYGRLLVPMDNGHAEYLHIAHEGT